MSTELDTHALHCWLACLEYDGDQRYELLRDAVNEIEHQKQTIVILRAERDAAAEDVEKMCIRLAKAEACVAELESLLRDAPDDWKQYGCVDEVAYAAWWNRKEADLALAGADRLGRIAVASHDGGAGYERADDSRGERRKCMRCCDNPPMEQADVNKYTRMAPDGTKQRMAMCGGCGRWSWFADVIAAGEKP